MLPSHTITLRSLLTGLKIQPKPQLLSPCSAPPSPSTTAANPLQRRFFTAPPLSTAITNRPTSTTTTTSITPHPPQIRLASTTTTTTTPLPSPSSPLSGSTSPTPSPLTWNAYLTLRKTRRRYNLAASLLSSLLTTAGGITFLTTLPMESVNVFGLDPFLVLGVATLGSGAVGWLLGPFVGERVFGLVYWRVGGWVGEKEKDFYRRIKKHRVDPSGGSSANPVPDYYGEKIGSVKEYRNWMKDQRAFNKRRQNFL